MYNDNAKMDVGKWRIDGGWCLGMSFCGRGGGIWSRGDAIVLYLQYEENIVNIYSSV